MGQGVYLECGGHFRRDDALAPEQRDVVVAEREVGGDAVLLAPQDALLRQVHPERCGASSRAVRRLVPARLPLPACCPAQFLVSPEDAGEASVRRCVTWLLSFSASTNNSKSTICLLKCLRLQSG